MDLFETIEKIEDEDDETTDKYKSTI